MNRDKPNRTEKIRRKLSFTAGFLFYNTQCRESIDKKADCTAVQQRGFMKPPQNTDRVSVLPLLLRYNIFAKAFMTEGEIMLMNNNEYIALIQYIKREIQGAQYEAALSVNKELIMLCYNIGKVINEHK